MFAIIISAIIALVVAAIAYYYFINRAPKADNAAGPSPVTIPAVIPAVGTTAIVGGNGQHNYNKLLLYAIKSASQGGTQLLNLYQRIDVGSMTPGNFELTNAPGPNVSENVASEEDCAEICFGTVDCNRFEYNPDQKRCATISYDFRGPVKQTPGTNIVTYKSSFNRRKGE
jgi:PAN domain